MSHIKSYTAFITIIKNAFNIYDVSSIKYTVETILLLLFFLITINVIVPWLVRFLVPKRLFNENIWIFKEKDFECSFYRKIKVSKWKSKLPDAERLIHFQRSSLPRNIDEAYINRFITECCIAELGHLAVGISGFFSLLFPIFFPENLQLRVGVIFFVMSVIDLFAQSLFIIIQRYNRPRLIRLKKLYRNG